LASLGAFCVLRFCRRSLHGFVLLNLCVVVMAQVGMAEFVRFAAAEACTDDARRTLIVPRVIGLGACVSMIGPFSASVAEALTPNNEGGLLGFAYYFCVALL